MLVNLALSAALVLSPPTFAQEICPLPQTTSLMERMFSFTEEEKTARKEIVEMCEALEDENVASYLFYPTVNVEKVYADYQEKYEKPYEELKNILIRLNKIKEYVPEEFLKEIDPKNNPTNTVSQVREQLEICREIQKIAEDNLLAEQEKKALAAGRVSGLNKTSGVNYYNGRKETYYSSRVLYHYRTAEWLLDEEGFYKTANGYYVVAAGDMPQGTVFEGSKGLCCVLDSGCAAGTTDYYVNW